MKIQRKPHKKSEQIINAFGCNKKKRCRAFLKKLMKLHDKKGDQHLLKPKGVSHKTYSFRWYFIYVLSAELYTMGYQVLTPEGIKQKHCIALCKGWEAKGFSASTIANRKSLLKGVLSWMGKESTIDDLQLSDLFIDPSVITRKQKTVTDKSLSARLKDTEEIYYLEQAQKITPDFQLMPDVLWESSPLSVIQDLWVSLGSVKNESQVNQRYFIVMLEVMYWFGLRPREAAFFNPAKHIRHDKKKRESYCHVVKQGSKGGRVRKVVLLEKGQAEFVEQLQSRLYCRKRIMPEDASKTDTWMRAFNRYCVSKGLSKKEKKNPYSLRHEYAQRTYEHISGQPSPIRAKGEWFDDQESKKFVSQQLGHNRPSVAGAYIG